MELLWFVYCKMRSMDVPLESTPEAKVSLEVLTAMITPAILISACAALILSTSQRLGRIMDRIRQFSDVFFMKNRDDTQFQTNSLNQMRFFLSRARLLQTALMNLYLAVTILIVTSLMIGLTATTHNDIHWLPVAMALLGILVFLFSSSVLIREGYLAKKNTSDEVRLVEKLIQSELKGHELKEREMTRNARSQAGSRR